MAPKRNIDHGGRGGGCGGGRDAGGRGIDYEAALREAAVREDRLVHFTNMLLAVVQAVLRLMEQLLGNLGVLPGPFLAPTTPGLPGPPPGPPGPGGAGPGSGCVPHYRCRSTV